MAYLGFSKLKRQIEAGGGARNAGAVAAEIGRKKYGSSKFKQLAAAARRRVSERKD
jgi:hypothetical protein